MYSLSHMLEQREHTASIFYKVLHGKDSNKVAHANFFHLGPAERNDLNYVLLIKDDICS